MKYAEHHNELNFVTDECLHEAFAKMTDRELTRICIALHNNEDDLNAVAEGMVEQIASEKRYAY